MTRLMTYIFVNVGNVFRICQGTAAFRFMFAATVRNGITDIEMRVGTPAGVVINSATLKLHKRPKVKSLRSTVA